MPARPLREVSASVSGQSSKVIVTSWSVPRLKAMTPTTIFVNHFAWMKKTGVGLKCGVDVCPGSIHPRPALRLPVGWRPQRRSGALYFSNVRTNGVGCATLAIAPARRDGQAHGRGAFSAC